ncbi:MAG: 4-hydroxyphenylpyruvate dioxygenase [Candidatus Dormibacteria bacterium]
MKEQSQSAVAAAQDFMPIQAVDHIAIYSGNAKQAAHFYEDALGFTPVAYMGPETGTRDRVVHVLRQRDITITVAGALSHDHAITRFVAEHGDGVASVALRVPDCERAWQEATARGAEGVLGPIRHEDENGHISVAWVRLYGDVQLTFVERDQYRGVFGPGFEAVGDGRAEKGFGLNNFDHIVGNVELGRMNHWVEWFQKVLGFEQLVHFDDQDISTEYSALMSKVMQDGRGKVKFPINEPAAGRRKSQIEEFLEFNSGPGVQHIALHTGDIVSAVGQMQERGLEFLVPPRAYYEDLWSRIGEIREDTSAIEKLGILVDRDEEGYLLQIFSKPVQDRPTMFFEVIQRHGSRGFGKGNFKALFEAIEREQERRGNL